MQSMRKIWMSAAVIIAATGLAACSSGPQLSTVNPAGLDFSGTWLIDFSESNTVADLGDPRRPGTRPGQRMTRKDAVRIATGSDLEYISNDFQVLRIANLGKRGARRDNPFAFVKDLHHVAADRRAIGPD